MSGKRLTIYAAIAANLAIAATKFVAAAATSSGALFSEGIHSLVDTGDGLLLLLGLHLSHRPATARHPYGHGLEVYFWSMVIHREHHPSVRRVSFRFAEITTDGHRV